MQALLAEVLIKENHWDKIKIQNHFQLLELNPQV